MSNIREQLFNKFKNGEVPTGNDFRLLIENSFNDNVEVYTKDGIQTRTMKMFVGNTTVTTTLGGWSIDYANVGFSGVISAISSPIQNTEVTGIGTAYLASVVHNKGVNGANGIAFNASVRSYPNSSDGVSLAAIGTEVQVIVIGY